MQDCMNLVLQPRAMAYDLVAAGHQPTFALGGGVRRPDLGQEPAAHKLANVPASILSVFTWAWAIALTWRGFAMITRATNCDSTRETAMLFPVASITTSSVAARRLPRPSSADPVMSTRPACRRHRSPRSPPRQRFVDVHSDDASHVRLPVIVDDGSGGRHDTYGFALSAQPGESQRRPANNTSSQLIVHRPTASLALTWRPPGCAISPAPHGPPSAT